MKNDVLKGAGTLLVCLAATSCSMWKMVVAEDYDTKCPMIQKSNLEADMGGYREDCGSEKRKYRDGCIMKVHNLASSPFQMSLGTGSKVLDRHAYIFYPGTMSCDKASFYVLAQVKGQSEPCFARFVRFRKQREIRTTETTFFGGTRTVIKYVWEWHYTRDIEGCGIKSRMYGGIARNSKQFQALLDVMDRRESDRISSFEGLNSEDPYTILKKLYPFPLSDWLPKNRRVIGEVKAWLSSSAYKEITDFKELSYGDVLVEEGEHNRLALYLGRGVVGTWKEGVPRYERLSRRYPGAYRLVPAYVLMGYQPSQERLKHFMDRIKH